MTPAGFLRLALQTLIAPREVARLLLAADLSREAIMTAFALVVVVNALVVGVMQGYGMAMDALPVPVGPAILAALLAGMLGISIFVMTSAGRALGGSGRMQDVAVLFIWLQALRALVQVGVALMAMISGSLAMVLVLAAMLAGIWIVLNFLDVAHGLDNLFKALMVLILGAVGMVLLLSLLFSLMGLTPTGMTYDV